MHKSSVQLIASLFAGLLASQALAITHTWNGGNAFGPDAMNNASNWSGGVPVTGSSALTLIFPGSPSSNTPNQNIASPLSLQSLSITGSFYTFSGSGFQFSNLGANPSLTTNASTNSTFNVPMTFSASTTVTNNGFSTWNGFLAGSGTINLTATQQLNIAGAGPSSYNGLFNVNSGVVVFQRNGTVTNGPVNVGSGGTIYCNVSNQFGPNSDYTSVGGALVLNANQTLRNLTLGGLAFASFSSSNTLTVTGNISTTAGASSIGNNSFDTLDLNGGPTTINVSVAGASNAMNINASLSNGTFNKTGPGILNIFSNGNTFTGTNIVSGGILRGTPSSIGTSVLNNATIALAGGGTFNTNVITGNGDVVIESGASLQLNAAQGYTGGTDVQLGAVVLGDASTLSGDYTSTTGINSGTVQINQVTNGTMAASFSGGVQVRKFDVGILTIGGTNTQNGSVDLAQGGLIVTTDAALGVGTLNFGLGLPVSLEAAGSRTLANPVFLGSGTLSVVGSGNFNFTNAGAKVLNAALVHSSTGNTAIAGKFSTTASSSINVSSGSLTLGDAGIVGGFVAAGPISISGGTLTLKSLNFISLPDVTLAGGTLNAPNGYAIPLGAALQGNGSVTGRVASANGSTILANGNLTLGDASHSAGINLDGELYTNANTVTLLDSNQAVVGSLTRVGTVSANGTLVAGNGMVVNFGRNIAGRGQVQSTNTLAAAIIMNGDAAGDSITNYLEFTGYVKGVGTFNNVAFSGTFSPGLSPALLTVGSLVLTPSNVLDIELGGLIRGSQYDAFDVTGTMALDGQLKLTLINAFVPSAGDQFDIINGTTVGAFSSFNFPPLTVGLVWNTSQLYSQGIVQVVAVPEPASLGGLVMIGAMIRRRRH